MFMKKTWTRNDIIEEISDNVGLSLSDSSKIIEDILTCFNIITLK